MSHDLETLELHADVETPVSTFLKLAQGEHHAFLYESVEGAERWATYSIIGIGARRSFSAKHSKLEVAGREGGATFDAPDPLDALRTAAVLKSGDPSLPPFVGGIFGFLAYDAVRCFEPLAERDRVVPDAYFFEPEVLAVFDNRRHRLVLYSSNRERLEEARSRMAGPVPPRSGELLADAEVAPLDSREGFMDSVKRAKEYIRAGDIIQAVLSRRFTLPRVADAFTVYRGLRVINPSPYLYFLRTPAATLAGASPEVMVRVENGSVVVRPIAGTRPRGASTEEDAALAAELLADPKERAEHIMLVDLGRNDVGRVSEPGGVCVSDLMVVENYSHVMHIVSEVRGTLAKGCDAFDALRAAFPAGTLSGAPKVRAMQIIDELESAPRGIYGGAVGYFGPSGNADFGIAIRTLVDDGEKFLIQAGAGIVADSEPEKEADETEHKARAVVRAASWASAYRQES